MIRVLIADDHPVVRKGLIHILADAGIEIAAEANNAAPAIGALKAHAEPDVIILDVNMPDRSGLDLIPEIRRDYSIPILILSQYPAEQIAVRAIRAGAAGYLNKESAPEQLVEAVQRLNQGRKFIPEDLVDLLADAVEGRAGQSHQALSAREFEVFIRIAKGEGVSAIAEALHLSVKTVSTYRTRILEKLSLKTNAEISLYAIRQGLFE